MYLYVVQVRNNEYQITTLLSCDSGFHDDLAPTPSPDARMTSPLLTVLSNEVFDFTSRHHDNRVNYVQHDDINILKNALESSPPADVDFEQIPMSEYCGSSLAVDCYRLPVIACSGVIQNDTSYNVTLSRSDSPACSNYVQTVMQGDHVITERNDCCEAATSDDMRLNYVSLAALVT